MTTRGRPPALPIESPDWIPYAAALQDALNRYRSMPLAIQKLDDALASGTIRCKIERIGAKPGRIKRSDRVAMIYLPDELREPWDEHPYIRVNGEPRPGWLFLWNFDRIKYFGDAVEEAAAKPVEMQETAAAKGRLLRSDWVESALFADFLRRNSRGITRNHVVHELQQRLAEEGVKVPGDTELQAVVKQVFTFAEHHSQKPR
jgi:hypothetical protein